METKESLLEYYITTKKVIPSDLLYATSKASHFNILKCNNSLVTIPFTRKDYYKFCLTKGNAILYTESGEVTIDKPTIFFSNPDIRFGWKSLSDNYEGYICIFNELYLNSELKKDFLMLYEQFKNNIYPFIFLEEEQYELMINYFQLMIKEYNDNYKFKNEIIESTLRLVIYNAIKFQSSNLAISKPTTQYRIVNHFLKLLNCQFPVDSPQNAIKLKAPIDFANELNTHVNHLNHLLKTHIGKTTSEIIKEKITLEAIDLLKNTDWNITEIGYSLGFDYPQHFTAFFKNSTGKSPRTYKIDLIQNI